MRRGHDVRDRVEADRAAGVGLACVSLSAPLGIERLDRTEADELLDAWHTGARALPEHFRAWASVPATEIGESDLRHLAELLREDFLGVQLPASELATPGAWERAGEVLRVAELAGRPVFVHPGAEPAGGGEPGPDLPPWWAPVVGYASQMQAAWWGWHAVAGRAMFPSLRVLFGAGAGLAPVHHERHVARGGASARIDAEVFVDTSSYGRQGVDALARVLGIDVLVLGSDRPYGEPLAGVLGEAATRAIRETNPRRLLDTRTEGTSWLRAS